MKNIFTVLIMLWLFNPVFLQSDWNTFPLGQKKCFMGAAVLDHKAYFAGGQYSSFINSTYTNIYLDTVEIFDPDNGTLAYDRLSSARSHVNAIAAGVKIYFAGGIDSSFIDKIVRTSDRVDIYDPITGQWSVHHLSQARYDIESALVGDKIIFAGGSTDSFPSDVVDIYNLTTGEWSVQHLSSPTFGMGVAVTGSKVYFAGGFDPFADEAHHYSRKVIDIYNAESNTWSIDSLSEPRTFIGGATIGDKLMFAGGSIGYSASKRVDVFDLSTSEWSIDSLSIERSMLNSYVTTACNKAYFIGGDCINISGYLVGVLCNYNIIDIYDEESGSWSTDTLPYGLKGHNVLSIDNQLVVAGGITNINWASIFHDKILTRDCGFTSTQAIQKPFLRLYPNPTVSEINFDTSGMDIISILLIDLFGQTIRSFTAGESITLENLPSGLYYVKVIDKQKHVFISAVVKL